MLQTLPLVQALELWAVIAFGCFGVLLARSKQMDAIGVFSIAFIVAFGGGTLRDVLLDRQPLFWIQNEVFTWCVFGIALVGTLLPRLPARFENWLHLPDALGLGMFSVAGASTALRTEAYVVSPFVASLFGVMTGAFGGVIADVVCNEVPRVFRPTTPLYASCAFLGCWVYLGLRYITVDENVALWTGAAATVGLRLLALRYDLRLPPVTAA